MTAGGFKTPLASMGFRSLRVSTVRAQVRAEFNPKVLLMWPDRPGVGPNFGNSDLLLLDEFLEENAETLTIADIQSICDFLLAGKVYQGGGGAAERWTLEVSP